MSHTPMRGSDEEEIGKGSLNKYETILNIHKKIKPSLYLEIGVQKGRSLNLASCKAIGVDPLPRTIAKSNQKIYPITSDEFFLNQISVDVICPDLIFIDGLHLFEQALKDFINCEKISHPKTVILIDDIFPAHPSQALRNRKTQKWAGDVWKLYDILKRYRKDLTLTAFDVFPTGLLMVENLNHFDVSLPDRYEQIVDEYMKISEIPPSSILNRE